VHIPLGNASFSSFQAIEDRLGHPASALSGAGPMGERAAAAVYLRLSVVARALQCDSERTGA
jgi:hypothetical protein